MTVHLPERYKMRSVTEADLAAVTAFLNQRARALIGVQKFEVEELRLEWESPNFKPEEDICIILTEDDIIVGYIEVWDSEPHVRIFGWGGVHPDYENQGLLEALLAWAEVRARRSAPKAPEGTRVVLLHETLSTETGAHAILRAQGYELVRYFLRMVIEMDGPPPRPQLTNGIKIRPFVRGKEERDVVLAVRDAFRDHWGHVERPLEQTMEQWAHWMDNDPDFDPDLWFVAMDGDEIAGMSLCHPKNVEDPDMGWVNTLGVRRPWRRQGVALALLHHSFGELYRRGKRRVGLGVDAQSLTGATRLYEKAGMRPARQYATFEKELRAG
ncbi:MAG: GNAT family N-acetyltransferase, partial [Anaerolineae bacterium]|nr:GNAT family N-acetyltransferase [Anaerolineae bacterium]